MGNKKQTHCKRGHEFSPENTRIMSRGKLTKERICVACKKMKSREWHQRYKQQHRKAMRERFYGKGAWNHYVTQLEIQKHSCAICGIHVDQLGHALSQDHNHTTKRLQGLLCDNCNQAIGKFKENPVVLARALDYILEWSGRVLEEEKCLQP